MIFHTPFIVGAGELPESVLLSRATAISRFWGGDLITYSSFDSPTKSLDSLSDEDGLGLLFGDPAHHLGKEGSWLEALAAWRHPTILIVLANPSGRIPGMASAYVALCKKLSVPLLGIVQLGGEWSLEDRRLDGLPWCGWLPEEGRNDQEINSLLNEKAREIVYRLRTIIYHS